MKNNNEFLSLTEQTKINAFSEAADIKALPAVAIEKDWWVTAVLRALFSLPYAEHLSFKGGTSLSKCWKMIERFSEDVDIAINREYLGFEGTLSKNQINNRLRRAACSFVREKLQTDLKNQLEADGINPSLFSVNVNITSITTTDPEIIEIVYQSLFEDNDYIKAVVKIEVSGRSMNEPLQRVQLQSILDEIFQDKSFINSPFEVNAVMAERTFIEKICLLHEEFAGQQDFIRSQRMSRHLYDLVRIMDSPIAENALKDKELYKSVIEHRRRFVGLKDFDYDTLEPIKIKIIPPQNIIAKWKQDYEIMQRTMIYGESLAFDKLMEKIQLVNEKVNQINWY